MQQKRRVPKTFLLSSAVGSALSQAIHGSAVSQAALKPTHRWACAFFSVRFWQALARDRRLLRSPENVATGGQTLLNRPERAPNQPESAAQAGVAPGHDTHTRVEPWDPPRAAQHGRKSLVRRRLVRGRQGIKVAAYRDCVLAQTNAKGSGPNSESTSQAAPPDPRDTFVVPPEDCHRLPHATLTS